MAEKGKPEVAPQKRSLKLSPALGDWTTYKPPRQLVKRVKIGLYGFDRLSEEELDHAHTLHYRYIETWLNALKMNLQLGSQLHQVDAYQNTYANFLKGALGPLFQARIKLPDLHEEVFFSLDQSLANALAGAALGILNPEETRKDLTEADLLVLETTLTEYLKLYQEAFSGTVKSVAFENVGSPDIAPNPSVNPQSTFVYFVIELALNESHGRLVFGYPGPLIKKILKLMKDQYKPKPLALTKLNKETLYNIRLPLKVVLGRTELMASDIKKLEKGDVVSLDNSIKSAITIDLADNVVVLGQPGEKTGHAVVRVVGMEKEKEVKVAPPVYVEEKPAAEEPPPEKPAAPAKPAPAKPAPPPLKPGFGFGRRPIVPPPAPAAKEEEDEEDEFLDEDEFAEDEDDLEEEFEEEDLPEEETK